jgi:hypothetical protein
MKRKPKVLLGFVLAAGVIAISAACWHSVQEIHYLKTFFPSSFTVEEAHQAAVIELIKIALISFPVLVAMGVALLLGCLFGKEDKQHASKTG